jgi:hypothetical protein
MTGRELKVNVHVVMYVSNVIDSHKKTVQSVPQPRYKPGTLRARQKPSSFLRLGTSP